jgi:hypothetical protein
MAVRFFVSYKRNDPDTQRLLPPLRKALNGFRYNIFFKYRVFQDLDIDGGEKWKRELNRNIECADEFLLLLSAAAADSEYVQDEVRFADFFRTPKNRKPRILPIYVNLEKSENPKLRQILDLDDLEHLNWKSDEDTPKIISEIRRLVRKRQRPDLIKKTIAAVLAALLIVLFVYSMIQIAQIRNARSSVADALSAFGRLRAAERLLIPRLWLTGRWKPETLAAQALDEHAAPLLAKTVRKDVDHGLLLSAQAAVLRGGNITDVAQRVYSEQHYEFLATSIDAREEIAGRSLAVSSNAKAHLIAVGGHIWRCAEPIGQQTCVELAASSRQPVVAAAAFDSQTLRLVGYSGDATTLDLASSQESPPSATDATFVTADQGEVATSFDHRSGGGASVRVDSAEPSLRPRESGDLGRVKMLAFGPCDGCITTLGFAGVVKIWSWKSAGAGSVRVLPGKALLLAANRTGHRLAVISSAGDLGFYDADAKTAGASPSIDLTDAESMAISPDGRHAAVVHGGNVTIFGDATFWTLTAATKQPKAIAVAFAGNDYVVTRGPSDARVWRLRSTERRDLAPNERWTEWRKKFGLGGAGIITRED